MLLVQIKPRNPNSETFITYYLLVVYVKQGCFC